MANAAHIDILYEGVEAWNEWRRKNPGERPQLAGEDLSEMDLTGVNLGEADLDALAKKLAEAFGRVFGLPLVQGAGGMSSP